MAGTATAAKPKKKKRKAPARTAAQKKQDKLRLGAMNAHAKSLQASNPNLGWQDAVKLAGTAWRNGELGGGGGLGAGAGNGQLGRGPKKKKPKKKGGRRAPISPRRVSDLQRFIAPFVIAPAVTKIGVNVQDLKEAAAAVIQLGRLYAAINRTFVTSESRAVANLMFEPRVREEVRGLPLRAGAKRIFERFLQDRNIGSGLAQGGPTAGGQAAAEFLEWLNQTRDSKGNVVGPRIVTELLKDLDTTRRALGLEEQLRGERGAFLPALTAAASEQDRIDRAGLRLVQVITAEFKLPKSDELQESADPVPAAPPTFPALRGHSEFGRGDVPTFPAIDEVEAMGFPQTAGVDYAAGLGQSEFDVDDIQSLIEGDLDADLDSLLFAGVGAGYGQGDDVFDEFETLETLDLLGTEGGRQPRLGQTLEELDSPLDLPTVAGFGDYELGQEVEAGPEVPTIERGFADEGDLMVPGLEGHYGQGQGPGTIDAFFDPITNPDEIPLQPTPALFGTDTGLFGMDDELGQQEQAREMMVPQEDEDEDIAPFFEGLDIGLGQAAFGSDDEEEGSGFA